MSLGRQCQDDSEGLAASEIAVVSALKDLLPLRLGRKQSQGNVFCVLFEPYLRPIYWCR